MKSKIEIEKIEIKIIIKFKFKIEKMNTKKLPWVQIQARDAIVYHFGSKPASYGISRCHMFKIKTSPLLFRFPFPFSLFPFPFSLFPFPFSLFPFPFSLFPFPFSLFCFPFFEILAGGVKTMEETHAGRRSSLSAIWESRLA
jgi:hypothetical protein